jgi:hypothetical protein
VDGFTITGARGEEGGGIYVNAHCQHLIISNNVIRSNGGGFGGGITIGRPHAAGLVSETHSDAFRATLPPDDPGFSNPVLFNNIFWDNRAGVFDQTLEAGRGGIAGIGAPGDPRPVNVIDL